MLPLATYKEDNYETFCRIFKTLFLYPGVVHENLTLYLELMRREATIDLQQSKCKISNIAQISIYILLLTEQPLPGPIGQEGNITLEEDLIEQFVIKTSSMLATW